MNALTSINKPHTDNIFAANKGDRKTVEWRTKPLPKGKHYVYETKNKGGCGKVIGEIRVLGWRKFDSVDDIPDEIIRNGKVSREFIKKYAKGRPIYANALYGAKRYDMPKELGEFNAPCPHKTATGREGDCPCKEYGWDWDEKTNKAFCTRRITHPPQSWCRVEDIVT